ncbi:hypothetical protein O4J56_12085 [Nocardiopsis sp. RSe5-2]|uniref:DUF3618 domain-containing protein n=1 Tax=Nocardiopsis endophytica TaxID=3018445 RepID=A0ABT4U343_9ACTN|nr:hypothetical protein [Nocardiopsis endophytica]MDA2811373.1 hypothetical protein [Nocardiopsis endophytica]
MAIQMKRRKAEVDAEAAMARLQELAREQRERLGPYADQARAGAERGLLRARGWTAPRLESAALRVEDTVAPRVADLLTTAAQRVEPNRTRRGLIAARHSGRRVPKAVVFAGVAALGAAAVYGAIRLRKAAQDAEWQENLDQAREQVRETREQLQSKAREAKEAAKAKTGEVAGVGAGPEADGAAKK